MDDTTTTPPAPMPGDLGGQPTTPDPTATPAPTEDAGLPAAPVTEPAAPVEAPATTETPTATEAPVA